MSPMGKCYCPPEKNCVTQYNMTKVIVYY